MIETLLHLPTLASHEGYKVDQLILYVHLLMLALFVGWTGYFLFVLYRFRSSRQPNASYEGAKGKFSKWVEVGVVIAEGVLLLGFSIPVWAERAERFPPPESATVVRVIGEQFAWNIHYPGPDGVFGRVDINLVDPATNPIGLDRSDPRAADDVVTVNQLHLPVDKPVIVHVSSKDVIHSFVLQEMRVKQDAIPGMSVPVWFTPDLTTEELRELRGDPEAHFEIGCAQLCGLGHYRMRGFMTVETQEAFDAWYQEQLSQQSGGADDFWGS